MLTLRRKRGRISGNLIIGLVASLIIAAAVNGQESPKVAVVPIASQKKPNLQESTPAKRISPQVLLSVLGSADVGRLEELLADGVDPNFVVSPSGRTLLMTALSVPMVRLLLAHGADPRIRDGRGATAMHHAVMSPEALEIIPLLLEKGADIDAVDDLGYTVLTSAVVNDRPDLVRLMLDSGADPGIRTREGQSALDWAQDLGIVDIVDLLEAAYAHR